MNITSSDNIIHDCTGCQMCAAVCPTSAISIIVDNHGFYKPSFDKDRCIECGQCVSVCYKYDDEVRMTKSPESFVLYGAKAKDPDILAATTSGGMADILAMHLVSEGYVCVGVYYDVKSSTAFHKSAYCRDDVLGFRGSKYIQSYTFHAFREIVEKYKDTRFAVFGLPCQIYAISRFLERKKTREGHLLVDMYCHGVPSMLVWQKYVKEINLNSNVQSFDHIDFRSKAHGWGNYVISAQNKGTVVFTSNHRSNQFYSLFFSDLLLNDSCYDCSIRSTMEYADIRLGDFWGKIYNNDRDGVSAVSIITTNGQKVFDAILDKIVYKRHNFKDIIPYQTYGKIYAKNPHVSSLLYHDLIADKPLYEVVRTLFRNQTAGQKLKRNIKSLLSLLPDSIMRRLKQIYYNLL